LNSNNKIVIIKLGGSLLTEKNKPFSIRKDTIETAIEQIIRSQRKLILIHGGGSFGHPVAKKYNISSGMNPMIENQILGLTKTHDAMNKLNSYIIEIFLKKKYPAISIQPSSIFVKENGNLSLKSINIIRSCLNHGILPVLYGDIVFDKKGSFSIISGDDIVLALCKKLDDFDILKVIFVIEKDGLYIKENGEDPKLATDLFYDDLDKIILADLGQKIDVTGGIKRKVNIIKKISQQYISVQIINGLKENYIFHALIGKDVKSTQINIKEKKKQGAEILTRKLEHLKIPLENKVQYSKNYFDSIQLIHNPLPDYEFNEIDLSTTFFGKNIDAPICISAITGGHPLSKAINRILAKAAEEENIIMSVGSQRIALEDISTLDSFKIVREVAPNIPIIGNIGIGQITSPDFNVDDFIKCIEMINADVMAIHFNALHELIQSNGNISFTNFREKFQNIRRNVKIPIIAKEVGTGFNKELATNLDSLRFDGFDVGGTGGTSFAAIESHRDRFSYESYTRKLADTFREWGIPTPVSIIEVRKATKKLIIATGGLRTGIDIAKSIVLGADIGGFAYKFLKSAWNDYEHNSFSYTLREIKTLKDELCASLWLMNLKNTKQLKCNQDKQVILGELYKWVNQ
jgi:isopentenyl-diphosphate delta-isomerase